MSSRQTPEAVPDVDDVLRSLGKPCAPPALCDELEAELAELAPVKKRSPHHSFAVIAAISLLYGLTLLLFMDLRPDLHQLPRGWMVAYSLAWLASFVTIAYLASVPARGQVSPNWRYAGIAGAIAAVCFVLGGLFFDRHAPGASVLGEATMDGVLGRGFGCVSVGALSALVPVFLGALLLRGRLPVGSRFAGAGLGAAGGSLGGLVLHLHCHIADALHLGIIHGGIVVIGAMVGALLLPRAARL